MSVKLGRSLRIGAIVAVASACGGASTPKSSPTTTVTTTAPSPSFKADTSWGRAVLHTDGTTLTIEVSGAPIGDGPCNVRYEHEVIETDTSVTVAFRQLRRSTTTRGDIACPAIAMLQPFVIHLKAPLGERKLYDGVDTEPKQVWRMTDIVEPTVLPDGITIEALERVPSGKGTLAWMQYAEISSGPGWDLFIDQAPAGSFVAPETSPGTIVGRYTVHGNDAAMYEYFNFTGHEIHWTEGGLDITVRAELHTSNISKPQSFENAQVAFIDPLLVRIADGIVVH